ncbi:MAG: hypothetical protein KBE91_00955 [Bacteroidia bacterium]|nr:hypothetical protein [Bacteroidia bacterium]MBP9688149.1 hypothetical protein [Bacteroidia bacterium]
MQDINYFLTTTVCIVLTTLTQAQVKLNSGDLLFQNIDCGPLCDAIEQVTNGKDSLKFSHIGMVYLKADSVYVIEAIGKAVVLTPYVQFKSRTTHKLYLGRLKITYQTLIDSAINFALNKVGTPYDEAFLYNNQKYYCSELIYDAFKAANNNEAFFKLEPMTFKLPNSNTFFNAWVDYYKKLGIEIPEGKPGINPAGISTSNKLNWIGIIN